MITITLDEKKPEACKACRFQKAMFADQDGRRLVHVCQLMRVPVSLTGPGPNKTCPIEEA